MNFAVQPGVIVTFLLVMTRLVTVLTVAPPFGGSTAPVRVRVAIAASVALVVAPLQTTEVSLDTASLVVGVGYQVVVGAMFGYLIQLLLAAPLVAGSFIDYLAGFSSASLFDPFSNSSTTPVGRLNQMITTIILVVMEGHLLIIRGVLRSYEVAPVNGLRVDALGPLLTDGIAQLILAAFEIALPLIVALLLTEVVLGLAAKAAPRLNVMVVGFAVKSLVVLFGLALILPLLVNSVATLLDRALRWAVGASGA